MLAQFVERRSAAGSHGVKDLIYKDLPLLYADTANPIVDHLPDPLAARGVSRRPFPCRKDTISPMETSLCIGAAGDFPVSSSGEKNDCISI